MFLGLFVRALLDNFEPSWITCVSGLFCDVIWQYNSSIIAVFLGSSVSVKWQ